MLSNLGSLLIGASSADPAQMQAASSQLQQLSKSNPEFVSQLANTVLLNVEANSLPANAQLLGLIYLKNIVLNHRLWPEVDRLQQEFLLRALFSHLADHPAGSQSRFIAEILSGVFRHEWTKGTWPDRLWGRLIELEAWLPLRRCVQRAASLRLPTRRKMLSAQVTRLLPQLASIYVAQQNDQLLHAIYTCVTAIDQTSASQLLSSLPEMTESLIWHAFTELKKPIEFENDNRLAKFLHAVFVILPENLRSGIALQALQILSEILPLTQRSPKAMTWVLGLLYNLLGAAFGVPSADSFSRSPSLTEDTRAQIQLWLLADCKAVQLLQYMIRCWMPLERPECDALFSNPEASYSCGGAQISTGDCDKERLGHALAVNIWNSEGVLLGPSTYILIGTRDLTPRQIAEAIFVLITKNLADDTILSALVIQFIEDLYHVGLTLELQMRCAQLCLPYRTAETEPHWFSLVEGFLQQELWSTAVDDSVGLTALCRQLALMVHRAVLLPKSNQQNEEAILRQQCSTALARLVQALNYSRAAKVQSIGVRLAAAHCLHWLLEHVNFQPESLAELLPQVLEAVINLAECVDEVETRLLILSYLRSIFEAVGVEENPEHCLQFLNVLDRLWRIGEGAAALRASILELLALLLYALNANPETGPAQNPHGLAAQLRDKVIAVVATDLTAHRRTGCGTRGDDNDDDGDDNCNDDAEVLFEPSLRLWHSLVSGKGATWSPGLEQLMPVLTGGGYNTTDGEFERHSWSFDRTLYARLESSEHAQLFFEIAHGCLRLGSSPAFLARWTEPFWAPALTEAVNHNAMHPDRFKLADGDNSADDTEDSQESRLILDQLSLLVTWTSRLVDTATPISHSVSGLLLLHIREVFHRAPVEVHADAAFKSNQARLLLLAQLACSPSHWNYLLNLIQLAQAPPEMLDFKQACLSLVSSPAVPLSFSDASPPAFFFACLQNLLARLLARADSLSNGQQRCCFAVAGVFCLLRLVPPEEEVLNEFLESITSLCVQVLSDADTGEFGPDAWVPPKAVATQDATRNTIRELLQEWRKLVGGDEVALFLLSRHVDPALLNQLNQRLS